MDQALANVGKTRSIETLTLHEVTQLMGTCTPIGALRPSESKRKAKRDEPSHHGRTQTSQSPVDPEGFSTITK